MYSTLIVLTESTVASALSGAFGGLLAYAILYMDGVAGLKGWRWYNSIPSEKVELNN
jgi:uncharacterized membrane protein